MYVRLKHTLSALALEAMQRAPRRRPTAWLLAYARLAPRGERVPLSTLRREAARYGAAGPRGLSRFVESGILERADGAVRLAPGYVPHAGYLVRQVERLGRALSELDNPGTGAAATPLARGLVLFNTGLFFECHEYLEDVWRRTTGPDRDFYHAIIQAAAAFYHFEKDNLHGARTLLEKALAKLAAYAPSHLRVDVDRLIADLELWRRRFRSDRPGGPLDKEELPRIRTG